MLNKFPIHTATDLAFGNSGDYSHHRLQITKIQTILKFQLDDKSCYSKLLRTKNEF